MKKSLKLLTLTLLSTMTVTVPLTVLISSCANNTHNSDSSIVINSQSPSITNMNSTSNPPTLFVDAKSNEGDLSYAWSLSKDDGKTWQYIEGATGSSYTISDPEINKIGVDSTWQYKVEIKLNDSDNVAITSNIYKVNIKPTTLNAIDLSQDLLSTIALTSDEDLSLSVGAMSKSDKPLWYQWYLQKEDGSYYKVQNSTNSSYKVSSAQYQNIKNLESWKAYVEVYVEGEENTRLTSNVCTIEITPKVKTQQVTTDLGPTPKDPISARPYNSEGLTTVQYDTEKWLGDNSMSILLKCEPNKDYINKYVASYLDRYKGDAESSNPPDKFSYLIMQYFKSNLDEQKCTVSKSHSGTAWMLDYSLDTDNENLVNYYLATNIHVLDATYSVNFTMYLNTRPVEVTVNIPITPETVQSADIYLTQPQYSESNANDNTRIIASSQDKANEIDKYWWKTSITKNDFATNLIPIGSYTNMGSPSLATPYNWQLNYTINVDLANTVYNYTLPMDNSRAVAVQSYSTKKSSDFAVVKITEEKNKFSETKPSLNPTDSIAKYERMFTNVKNMFNVDAIANDERSSYIARLNSILSMLASKATYDELKAKQLFMFADYKKDLKYENTISVGGFPAIWKNRDGFVTFNSNTISYSYNQSYPTKGREYIEYYYNGSRYVSEYNRDINLLFKNINLMGGSSGSMAITNDYKIGGIYWGGINRYSHFDGAVTRLYSENDPSSMIQIWLKYIEQKDPNSKLLQLFTGLKAKNFFA